MVSVPVLFLGFKRVACVGIEENDAPGFDFTRKSLAPANERALLTVIGWN